MFLPKRGKAKKAKDAAKQDASGTAAAASSSVPFSMNDEDFDHRLGNYQLMEQIGKGGYGAVYRGLNVEQGMTVAVKRVNLQGIPPEELEGIEMEIRLLQNLDHPNIVKYLDSMRSDDYLNIILEYVENGSLSSLLVKFGGMFPEQLCSHYITQVLKGLSYLHTQGVIHRDIKGANILSTKEGQVKLADFGVATKLNESRKSDSVCGTPYWMAPEIIEMTGQQSAACDIWSVGCTCVELLTGKPPYFDLQQMPALFRIVQDDHPPLPDGISPVLEDFLMQCFSEDTEVLGYDGKGFRWLGVEELLALQRDPATSNQIQLASYNESRQTIEYHSLQTKVLIKNGQQRMVDVNHQGEGGSEHQIDISITHDHTMYVDIHSSSLTSPPSYKKQPAENMLTKNEQTRVSMLTHARNGIVPIETSPCTSSSSLLPPFASLLNLTSSTQLDAFLQLYGYWLIMRDSSSSSLLSSFFTTTLPSSLTFPLASANDLEHIISLLNTLEFLPGTDYTLTSNTCITIHRNAGVWNQFFCQESETLNSSILRQCTTSHLISLLTAMTRASLSLGLDISASKLDASSIHVHSERLRDDLLIACFHAGYSAIYEIVSSDKILSSTTSSPLNTIHYTLSTLATTPTLHAARDVRERMFEGRVWCVTLPPHHLVVARRRGEEQKPAQLTRIQHVTPAQSTSLPYDSILHSDLTSVPSSPFTPPSSTTSLHSTHRRTPSRPLIIGQCFQKDPNRRIDAIGLLKHPWLRKSVELQEIEEMKRVILEETANKSKGGNKSKGKTIITKHGGGNGGDSTGVESGESDWDEEDTVTTPGPGSSPLMNLSVAAHNSILKTGPGSGKSGKTVGYSHGTLPKSGKSTSSPKVTQSDNEDWDDENDMNLDDEVASPVPQQTKKPSHRAHLQSTAAFPKEHIKRGGNNAVGNKAPTKASTVAEEDDEDQELTIKVRKPVDDDDNAFADFSDDEDVVEKTSMKTIKPTPHITAAALNNGAGKKDAHHAAQPIPAGMVIKSPTNALTNNQLTSNAPAGSTGANGTSVIQGNGVGNNVNTLPASSSFLLSSSNATITSDPLAKLASFVENDEDELGDFADLEADFEVKTAAIGTSKTLPAGNAAATTATGATGAANKNNAFMTAPASTLAAQQKLSYAAVASHQQSSAVHSDDLDDIEDLDELNPFDDITFEDGDFGDDTQSEDLLLNRSFLRVLDLLSPTNDERTILDACEKLHEMGSKNPEQIRSLMTNHGVIPIMEMLEVTNTHILHAVLKVINQIVGKNIKFQQNMSLVGLIPAIIRFGGTNYPTEIRMESASFVRQFCYATDWTRKMFIACDGLPVLVSFLLEDYYHSKTLVWNAIDCIRHVFDINTSPKNDFCRLFCKFGLLEPLSKQLIAIQQDKTSLDAPEYVLKIAKILHLFSQGDKVVKVYFAKPAVIESMLRVLPVLPQDILILLLKSIRNISMDSTTLDLLEASGAIPALIPFLDVSQVSENQHQVLLTMYYLCQIKSSRQEQAALSGIIPHLQRFIRQDHPLKQFAYPIIFLLAKTSNRSRMELKKYGGLQFYIDILVSADLYWRSYALEIIAFWVSSSTEDAARVSFVLNTSSNINKLLRVFRETTDETQFDKLGNSMKKLLSSSPSVNQSMGRLKEFIREIKNRLVKHAASNNIRLTLLRILALMVSTHANPVQLINETDGLLELIQKLYAEKSAVIVSDMAQKILSKLAANSTNASPSPPPAAMAGGR